MESLAILVAAIVASVALSGVVAWSFTAAGYVYIGGTIGVVAITLGTWWVFVAVMPVALVGYLSIALGAWSVVHAWRGKPPY